MHLATRLCFSLVAALLLAAGARAQNFPDGFNFEIVVNPPFTGGPVSFAFLPDERVLLVERNSGAVRLSAVGSGTSSVILVVPNVTWANFEQGLLGIAVDPDWPARPYLYFYYTHVDSAAYLTMYEATGALTNPSSTAITLVNPYHVFTDLPDEGGGHNAGTLSFGPDGMLYLSLGDDQSACLAQDTTTANGKILRLDVSSMPGAGTGPPPKADITPIDNPFPGPDEWAQLVYAWGLRNPWKFNIDPVTGDLYLGDVGFNSQEEVDIVPAASPGGNYGWPQREGFINPMCCGNCGVGNTFIDPIYSYWHDANPKAVIGGPLYRPVAGGSANLPAEYEGTYFFIEWFDGWIRRLEKVGSSWQVATPVPGQPSALNWADNITGATDMQVGLDGALYVLKSTGNPRGLYRIFPGPSTGIDAVATSGAIAAAPNPATPASGTTIRFEVVHPGRVTLRILDVTGRAVRTLADGPLPAGARSVPWDGRTDAGTAAAPGTYFYRLERSGEEPALGKVSLIR
jgi:glucose/arabinose dehydrogenase